jgi:hypothetical protein
VNIRIRGRWTQGLGDRDGFAVNGEERKAMALQHRADDLSDAPVADAMACRLPPR